MPIFNDLNGVTGNFFVWGTLFATSPNLTTPILGTPTSGNLSNCTGFPNQDTGIPMRQLLGSPILAQTLRAIDAPASQNLTDGRLNFTAIYIPSSTYVTGAITSLNTAGVFTGDNENSISLYSHSASTLTRIAITANDQNIWKTTNTLQTAFGSPVTLSKGIYYLAILYNNSAQTTAPSCKRNSTTRFSIAETSFPLDFYVAGVTAAPATQANSGYTQSTPFWVGLY